MPNPLSLTPLNYALLGLIRGEARSGYALRRVFETTPMGNYSSSPGSIYPALKGLTARGLIASLPAKSGKNVFTITSAGLEALEAWLAMPVTGEDMGRNMDAVMLRFALLQDHADPQLTFAFLASFEAAARDGVRTLEAFIAGDFWRSMPLQSQLAVGYGLATCKSRADWAADAHHQLMDALNT